MMKLGRDTYPPLTIEHIQSSHPLSLPFTTLRSGWLLRKST